MAKMVLKLPKLAVSMREGTIVRWQVDDGAIVAVGQSLYDLESEKTTFEVESPFAGVISILRGSGTPIEVGEPVAEILI